MADISSVSLNGAMGLIKKSKFVLAPLFEALTNSLEAISAKEYSDNAPKIDVDFHFDKGLFGGSKSLNKISIIDNGSGFDEDSFQRFATLLDKTKGYNNRGSGRLQFLHRFGKIEITSIFYKDGKAFKRSFISSSRSLVEDMRLEELPDNTEAETTITFSSFNGDKGDAIFFEQFTIDDLKNALQKKFLLKFYLEQKNPTLKVPTLNLNFYQNAELTDSVSIAPEDIPLPQSEGELSVPYVKIRDVNASDIEWIPSGKSETLKWAYFKLSDEMLDQNGVFLCSKDVSIQEIPFLKIKKNESFDGTRYLTVVYGNVLDSAENVSDSVDRFLFPNQKDTERELKNSLFVSEDEEYFFIDNIEDEVKKALPEAYTEVEALKDTQHSLAEELAKKHGMSEDLARQINIDLSDGEEKITEKLYKKEAEVLSKNNVKIKQLFESLNDLNPTEEDYHTKLEKRSTELLTLIPQQNRMELSRYIIRREMVTSVLKLILDNKLEYQVAPREKGERRDNEGLIHDLIFKRKAKSPDALNDLWILNEEFLHFEGCSDVAINQIKNEAGELLLKSGDSEEELLEKFSISRKTGRPDIFLYAEEGKCVLIEFKAHEVDLSDHLNQLTRYCNLLANCAVKKIDQFYCYLIGENIKRSDLPGEFLKSVTGDFVKPDQPVRSVEDGKEEQVIAHLYQEVVQLSNIHTRASNRNKSFADKLGIRVPDVS